MESENYYLELMDKNSDDSLLEIVENPSKCDDSLMYKAAITISLNRELITDYQADELLNGNPKVLEYNPNNLGDEYGSDAKKNDIKWAKIKFYEKSNIHSGLYGIGLGICLIVFGYFRTSYHHHWGFFDYHWGSIILGTLAIIIGFILFLYGIWEKYIK